MKSKNYFGSRTSLSVIIISIFAFFLNFIWENAQAPFYSGYQSFMQHLWICTKATFGDVIIILLLYFMFAAVYSKNWIQKLNPRYILSLMVVGGFISVVLEMWAISIGRWSYSPSMPIIPFVKVGLLPVIQMMILPLLIFYLTTRIMTRE